MPLVGFRLHRQNPDMTDPLDELRQRLTSLTRDLILIPTTDSRPAERKRCFEFIHNHLDQLQQIRLVDFQSNGYDSLVVFPESSDVPEILLCGHLDGVEHPEPDAYHSKLKNGRIIGPGAGDMKGQLAIMMELFRSLHSRFPDASLGLAITSDEERGGLDGVRFLVQEAGLRCGLAIIPDGGSLNDVTIEEKGVIHLQIRCHGEAAHGARPWLGDNALQKLMAHLEDLDRHFRKFAPDLESLKQNHWVPTCALTVVRTPNQSSNRIPAEAEAVVDIRFPPTHTVAEMLNEVAEVLGPQCELKPLMRAEPTFLDPDELFCQITEEISGRPTRLIRSSGGSDGRFLRQFGIPVNLSRPLVGELHSPDEWIDIDSMVTYYRICEAYIERKLRLVDASNDGSGI